MTVTPWGEADQLRTRKLPPGPGRSPEAVLQSQRERLLAATVAVVAEKGYAGARVEDILVVAGVSRNAFYKQFANKRACFVATLEGISAFAAPAVLEVFDRTPGAWDEKLGATLDALAAVIVAQPAMAKLGWVEVYAGGPEAVEIVERIDSTVEELVCRALRSSPDHARMPREVVRAVVGGIRNMIRTRVRENRFDELPALMPELSDWLQAYSAPVEQLRRPRRVPPEFVASVCERSEPRERILDAVAALISEQGYPDMAITEVVSRAGVSLTTFYAEFDGKEAALLAALDDAQQRVYEATLPHFASAPDWPSSVAVGARAFLGFLATHPATAHFGGEGAWATSPAGLDLRAQGMAIFSALLDEGCRQFPDTPPLTHEAVGATLDALLFATLRHKGAERLYEVVPVSTFIALAPFVGVEKACELANAEPAGVA